MKRGAMLRLKLILLGIMGISRDVLLGVDGTTVELAVLYIRIYTGFLWPRLAQRTGTTFCRSQGIVRPVTFASAIGVCINIPLTVPSGYNHSVFEVVFSYDLNQVFTEVIVLVVYFFEVN